MLARAQCVCGPVRLEWVVAQNFEDEACSSFFFFCESRMRWRLCHRSQRMGEGKLRTEKEVDRAEWADGHIDGALVAGPWIGQLS